MKARESRRNELSTPRDSRACQLMSMKARAHGAEQNADSIDIPVGYRMPVDESTKTCWVGSSLRIPLSDWRDVHDSARFEPWCR